jgi:hypothetical protein
MTARQHGLELTEALGDIVVPAARWVLRNPRVLT